VGIATPDGLVAAVRQGLWHGGGAREGKNIYKDG
jgi:hypothetical protein